MDAAGWAPVSTYENPGNLSQEKTAILKGFWAVLLALFETKDVLSNEWDKHFPDHTYEGDSTKFAEILRQTKGEVLRKEFYNLLRHDYIDLLPLRFLKARSYDKANAMAMLVNALDFRRKNISAAMMSEANNDPNFIQALKKGKSFVPCYDNQGRTITCIRFANHSRGDCTQDVFDRYTLYAMEHAHLLHMPYQDRTVLLVDMTGFSITSLDLGAIKFIIQNFEQYYPEELSEGVIHNAPWLFGTAWTIIKPLLRPPTREKITFTSNVNDLAAKIGRLEAEKVIKAKMEYLPDPAPEKPFNDQAKDLATASPECQEAFKVWNSNVAEVEELTRLWMRPAATDTPMEELKALEEKRAAAAWKLSASYWKIDEYVRPKSYYDRAGLLPPSRDSALNLNARPVSKGQTSKPPSLKSQMSSLSMSK